MALLSLGESKWRMVRRALKKKRFKFDDVRNGSRYDGEHLEWLIESGFFADLRGGLFGLTAKGIEAADLGLYETEELPRG
jgi:hypothetical protein